MLRLDHRNSILSQGILAVYWGMLHDNQRATLSICEEMDRYSWPLLQLENRISQFSQLRVRNLLHSEKERPRRAKWRSASSSQPHFFTWQSEGSHDIRLSDILEIRAGEIVEASCPTIRWKHSSKSILVHVFTLKTVIPVTQKPNVHLACPLI